MKSFFKITIKVSRRDAFLFKRSGKGLLSVSLCRLYVFKTILKLRKT